MDGRAAARHESTGAVYQRRRLRTGTGGTHDSAMNDCSGDTSGLLPTLLRAGASVEAHLERSLVPWSLSLAKLRALHHLAQAPQGLPLGQLAERLCCVKSNVTQLVDRLEADGLVRRVSRATDRRCVVAVITDKGRESFVQAERARVRAEREMLEKIPDDGRAVLMRLLGHLTAGNGS